jgi:hypothetical protein
MFVVNDILVSDEVATHSFFCNLGGCLGACCVQGDSGAPLEESELELLEAVIPVTRKYLSPEALQVIDTKGCWEERGNGKYSTRCLEGEECVFVTYEGVVAKCSIQKAFDNGRTDFPKPISCHLFPIRIEDYGTHEVMNYEWAAICEPGRLAGHQSGTYLTEFLREPLVRKYGEEWFDALTDACDERRSVLNTTPRIL